MRRVDQQFVAVEANTFQDFLDHIDISNVEHRLGQLNVTEMARALFDI
jgi:hypothetical protein